MNNLILDALKQVVIRYPNIAEHLHGSARWMAEVYNAKMGDPNEEARMKDERRLERNVSRFLTEQQERVIKEIERDDTRKSVYQRNFWDDEESRMWNELSEDFVGILIHGADEGIVSLEGASSLINPDNINRALIEYARQYRYEWISKITDTTRRAVQSAVSSWLESGDPLDNLITMLSNTFSKTRAARIAATEVTRLRAKANQMAWQESGVVREFRWSTAMDDLVCMICAPREGKLFPLDQMDQLLPAHVNCRCVGFPVVDEDLFEQQQRQILGL